jgi:hypothetical protein
MGAKPVGCALTVARRKQGGAVSRSRTLIGAVALIGALMAQASPASASISFDGQWGGLGIFDGSFLLPTRIATGPSGNVYVTDTNNHRVQRFSSSGTFLGKWGATGSGDGQFTGAHGIATDSAGNVYVVDQLLNRVQKFSSTGSFLAKWGSLGSGDGQFSAPTGVAVDSSDNVYVADTGNSRVQKFSSAGDFLDEWGSSGAGDGQFTLPSGVAVDSSDDVYVADTGNSRVQKFSSAGVFLDEWGSPGSGDGQFGATLTPSLDLAVGRSDNVIVSDPANDRVEKFRPIGTFITKWGSIGVGPGEFNLPSGVAATGSGSAYVVDQGNSRVEQFHETDSTEPDTALDSGPSGVSAGDVSFAFSTAESELLGFECRLDTAEWVSCSSPKAYTNLPEGSHAFRVRAVDAAGNPDPSPATHIWTVDRTSPQTTIDSGPSGPSNDPSPSFQFSSSEPGSSFECRLDSNQSSDWQACSPPNAYGSLADGSHGFEVRAIDSVGNIDATPASRSFSIDSHAPPPPHLTATIPASPANDNHPRVKGNAQPGSTVRIYKTAGCVGTPLAVGRVSRFHSGGLSVSVSDNTKTKLRATATDLVGNVSICSAAREYVEDSKPPESPAIKATKPASPSNDNQPLVRGFAEAPSTVTLYTTAGCSGSPVASGAATPFHERGLPVSVPDDTTTKFRATSTDLAGNTSPCSTAWRYVEDSTPPETTIVMGPSGQTTNRRPTFRFESSEAGSTFRCRFDTQPFGRCSGPDASHTPYVRLSPGPHGFAVRAADRAGNVDPTPATRAFSIVP